MAGYAFFVLALSVSQDIVLYVTFLPSAKRYKEGGVGRSGEGLDHVSSRAMH